MLFKNRCQRYHVTTARVFLFCSVLFCKLFITYNSTPQKLSAWRMNHPGAPGAGVWPEDQKRHRERRKTRPPPFF